VQKTFPAFETNALFNKKFWEEEMANFPLIYEGQHRKRKKWEGDTR
jgi:hypothetical protein